MAALPVGANGMACAKPLPVAVTKALCAMPCCAARPMAQAETCCKGEHGVTTLRTLAKAATACPCEMESAPKVPSRQRDALVPGFGNVAAILPEAAAVPAPVFKEIVRPGIVGLDSGPPPRGAFLSDRGRAPPRA
ncbi:hypothetical protein EON79_16030 [bacterium]|nr:MAG: hypothetical protein EON79_16030 [bacterium]